jgi:hypothetical protein
LEGVSTFKFLDSLASALKVLKRYEQLFKKFTAHTIALRAAIATSVDKNKYFF